VPVNNDNTPAEVTLVVYGDATPIDVNAARLVDFAGVPCKILQISPSEDTQGDPFSAACVMVSASSLAAILKKDAGPDGLKHALFNNAAFCLVYGITDTAAHKSAVTSITNGSVSSLVRFDSPHYSYQVSSERRDITREFSGLSFGPVNADTDFGIVSGQGSSGTALVAINGLPFFTCLNRERGSLFLLACKDIVDPGAPADGSLQALDCFSRLIPVWMFLKHVFGARTWHNPVQGAAFTIDDPLLKKSYGFLNYSRITEEMDRYNFNSTIAFIPWNYKRTDSSVAKLITKRSDRFSLCVHGCEHTKGEFATTSVPELSRRIQLATQRMNAHERTTGVPYADIMVFPQGRFSSVSLKVLKSHNYFAAVNSSVKPQDVENEKRLTLADLLMPAVTEYGTFPLFKRRYPEKIVDFAMDLFAGRPALLVEHHGYFKEGYDKIGRFATELASLSPDLRWMGLGELLRRTCLQKFTAQDKVECKIFGNRQVIENPSPICKQFTVIKAEDGATPIRRVTVNGKEHSYTLRDGRLQLSIEIPAGSSAEIAINYEEAHPSAADMDGRQPLKDQLKVYVRRYLSEVRDNYLSRHERILALAYQIKNGRILTKGSEHGRSQRED
jgi:hypothetical protein